MLVAVVAAWGDQGFEGLVVPIGIWLIASTFVLGFSTSAFLANNVSMAFIVIAAGAMDYVRLVLPPHHLLHRQSSRSGTREGRGRGSSKG